VRPRTSRGESGADARYSWFHPPDGATFEAPYEDADAWAAVRAAVEREFGKVRTEALARRATTEAEAQAEAKAKLASTNSAKTNPSKAVNGANASTKPHAASAKTQAAQAGGSDGTKRAKRAAPHDEAHSSGAGAPVAKRARPGPAARARARASNMQRKMQAE
jgi:hypothetical protein